MVAEGRLEHAVDDALAAWKDECVFCKLNNGDHEHETEKHTTHLCRSPTRQRYMDFATSLRYPILSGVFVCFTCHVPSPRDGRYHDKSRCENIDIVLPLVFWCLHRANVYRKACQAMQIGGHDDILSWLTSKKVQPPYLTNVIRLFVWAHHLDEEELRDAGGATRQVVPRKEKK